MDLKTYNSLQVSIFKKYNIECKKANSRILFYKLCGRIALYRDEKLSYTVLKNIVKIIHEEKQNRKEL